MLLKLGHSFRHATNQLASTVTAAFSDHIQIKKCELTWVAAMLVNKSASQVTAKDGTKITIGNLDNDKYLSVLRFKYAMTRFYDLALCEIKMQNTTSCRVKGIFVLSSSR